MAIQISGSTVIHDNQDVQVSGVVTATSFHGDASQLPIYLQQEVH